MTIERLVGLLLGLAPRTFTERYGDEYMDTHRSRMEEARRRGGGSAWLLGVAEIWGVVTAVIRLRLGSGPQRVLGRRSGTIARAPLLDTVWHDVSQAARMLRRDPGFALAAIAVLALGIGANAAIFSAVNAFLFRPLPFAEPDRLVLLYETNPEFGWDDVHAAPANALDWRDEVEAFADLAMYNEFGMSDAVLQVDGQPVLVGRTTVTGNFFSVLGAEPQLGRALRFEETWAGSDGVAVISHRLWTERFGQDPRTVGSVIKLGGDERDIQIVGVMPPGFSFPNEATDVWYPYGWEPTAREEVWFRRAHLARPVARIDTGYTLEEADAQLQVVVGRLQEAYPATNRVMGAGLAPIRDFLVRDVRATLSVLLGAVGLLLVLACANVANLMLVRATDRSRDVALRHALGAGRGRVAGQFLTEGVLLAVLGGALGLGLGWAGVRAISELTDIGIAGATELALDARVVGFTVLLALASGVVFGLVPALKSGGGDIHAVLREGARGQTASRGGLRLSRTLVAVEVAVALVLVVGAGLMVRSSWLLRQVDPGFRYDGALAIELSVPAARYPSRDEVLSFWDRLQAGLEARPGIERAGMIGRLPLTGTSWSSQFQAEAWPPERVGVEILHRRADRGYFEALDIPLVRGRHFERTDGPDDPLVVVINETFAREHFPGEDPIGQKIAYDRVATPESTWYEIVGIVGDQHQSTPGVPVRSEVFESRDQDWGRQGWIVMRTSADPLSVIPSVRATVAELDPLVPIAETLPMRGVWLESMSRDRFILTLMGVFGICALLLATVGVYGVTAQAARRRTQEIGIRMALGASAPDVVGLMLRQALGVVTFGLAAGLVTAIASARVLETLLFGIEPTDPATLASVVALLGAAALVACYVPARRATMVDPVTSLRED